MSILYPGSPWNPRELGSLPGLKRQSGWALEMKCFPVWIWILNLIFKSSTVDFESVTQGHKGEGNIENTGDFNKFWAVKLLQASCQACSSCKISVTENILRSLYNLVSFECQIIQWSTCAHLKRRELVKLACFCWDTAWRDACFELALPQVCGWLRRKGSALFWHSTIPLTFASLSVNGWRRTDKKLSLKG